MHLFQIKNMNEKDMNSFPSLPPIPHPLRSSIRAYRRGIAPLLLIVAMAGYLWLSLHITFHRQDHLVTSVFDLGIFDQAVWLISRGHSLFLNTRGLNVFADHFDPILFFFAPVYWVWANPKALLFAQCLACAMGAYPIYRLAERRLGRSTFGLLFAGLYLCYPSLQWMNNFDFHPETLAIPFLLYSFWYMESKRWGAFSIMVILTLLCKETAGLTIAMIGAYLFFTKERNAGGITIAAGVIGMIIALGFLRMENQGRPSAYISLYADFGNSPVSILVYLLTHPLEVLAHVSTPDNMQYWVDLLFPLLFLPLLAPRCFAIALPALLANMLSNREAMHGIHYQYNALVIPPLFYAAIAGGQVVLDSYRKIGNPIHRVAMRSFTLISLLAVFLFSWTTGAFTAGVDWNSGVSDDRLEAIREGLALIPPNASVCAQTAIGAHLTDRQYMYMLPNPFQESAWGNSRKALLNQLGEDFTPKPTKTLISRIRNSHVDFIILGPQDSSFFPLSWADYHLFVRILLTDPDYGVIWAKEIIILKRGANHTQGMQLLRNSKWEGFSNNAAQ
jgi:uncharacterized membrane protein